MSTDRNYLRSLYEKQDAEELLSLHRKGTLNDYAYSDLENVLTSRSIEIPNRPTEPEIKNTPTPTWVRSCIFMGVMLFLNLFWIAIAKPIVGGGFIPQAIFVLLPLFFIWKKLFPKNLK